MFDKDNIHVVLYHGSRCADGLSAACVVKHYYHENDLDMPQFKAVRYGEPFPDIDCENKNVLIVDFSFDEKTINDLILKTKDGLLIIDHHQTSEDNLKNIPEKYKLFDKTYCGATLAWKYFFPTVKQPEFLDYIEAYDLWKLNSQLDWKSFNLVLSDLVGYSGDGTEAMLEIFIDCLHNKATIKKLLKVGKIMQNVQQTHVERHTNRSMIIDCEDPLKIKSQLTIAFCNTTVYPNEISEKLLKNPNIDLVLVYYSDFSNNYKFSARSRDYPSNKFSELFGGGGHAKASGFAYTGDLTKNFIIIKQVLYSEWIEE